MAGKASVNFTIAATDRASANIRKVNKSLGGLSTRSIAVGSAIGTAIGGLATQAIGALTGQIGGAIQKLGEQDKLLRRTNNVLETTGNVANTSAAGILEMSSSLEMLTGVEQESIQNGQNLLLTFTKIQNKTGEGNDIFDRATKSMVDLSTAMGGDTAASAIQLGKALNDPTRGVTALTRSGVSFTQAQKEQIKALQESGDMLGAQKIILDELEVQFGGAGEAAGQSFAGQMAILGHVVTGLIEDALRPLLPILLSVAKFITGTVAPALGKLTDMFGKRAGPAVAELGKELLPIGKFLENTAKNAEKVARPMLEIAKSIATALLPVLGTLGDFFIQKILPAMQQVQNAVVTNLLPPLTRLGKFIAEQIAPRIATLVSFLAEKLGPVITTVANVIATSILPVFGALAGFIVDVVLPAILALVDFLAGPLGVAIGIIAGIFDIFAKAIGFVFDLFGKFIKMVTDSPLFKIAEAIGGIIGNLFGGGDKPKPGAAATSNSGAPTFGTTGGGAPGARIGAPNVNVAVTLDGKKVAESVDTRIGRSAAVSAGGR